MDSHTHSSQVRRLEVVDTGRRRRWSEDEKPQMLLEMSFGAVERLNWQSSTLLTKTRMLKLRDVVDYSEKRRGSVETTEEHVACETINAASGVRLKTFDDIPDAAAVRRRQVLGLRPRTFRIGFGEFVNRKLVTVVPAGSLP